MKCKSCGSDLPQGAKFCGNCGSPVESDQYQTELLLEDRTEEVRQKVEQDFQQVEENVENKKETTYQGYNKDLDDSEYIRNKGQNSEEKPTDKGYAVNPGDGPANTGAQAAGIVKPLALVGAALMAIFALIFITDLFRIVIGFIGGIF